MRKNIFTKATMRRAAAFGLAGCMAAASLTGCGSSKTESTTAANAETKVEAEGESKAEAIREKEEKIRNATKKEKMD
jgi:hypothetical protein